MRRCSLRIGGALVGIRWRHWKKWQIPREPGCPETATWCQGVLLRRTQRGGGVESYFLLPSDLQEIHEQVCAALYRHLNSCPVRSCQACQGAGCMLRPCGRSALARFEQLKQCLYAA